MAKVVRVEGKGGVSWRIDYFDPNGKRVRQMFKKKKDAEAELGKRVSLIAEGRYLDVKKDYTTTLKELITKYEENFGDQASFKTFKGYAIEDIKEYFGEETRLSNIRYMHLETYRNHLKKTLTKSKTLRKAASINRALACFRHMLNKAVEWEMMEANPFNMGKGLHIKENNQRLRFLSQDEISRLRKECPVYLRNIVDCALNTGMRKGEILSLKWGQIKNGFVYLTKTKTNEARQIPINGTLERVFSNIKKYGEQGNVVDLKKKRKKIIPKLSSKDHVFTYNGAPIKDVKRAFKSAIDKAEISDFHFHDLRHTFASHLVMQGATIKDVQELLGHKDTKMTNRYAHLSPEHKKKAVSLLDGLTASEEKNHSGEKVDMSETCQIFDVPSPSLSVSS